MTRGLPWPVRPVPRAQRERYLAEGWWTDDTLGGLVDRSLPRDAGRHRQHLVRHASVARHLRARSTPMRCGSSPRSRTRGSRPATSSRSSSRTGGKRSSRSTASRWAGTCSCRSCTSTGPRKSASSSARAGRAPTSPPTATATSTTSTSSTAPRPARCRIWSCTSSSARLMRRRRGAYGASDGTSSTRPHRVPRSRRSFPMGSGRTTSA